MKEFLKKYKHGWVLGYFFIYVTWFFFLNQMTEDSFHPLYHPVDDRIPFCEWFIIPYYLWFAYIPLTILYFLVKAERKEYYQLTAFLFIGMTVALITYTIWPNGVYFRPELSSIGRDNFCIWLTEIIYKADVGTNCCPSIHCFNSMGVAIGIKRCKSLRGKKWIRYGSIVLSVLICMSTLFVKQHSIIDVFWAGVLAVVMYVLVYTPVLTILFQKKKVVLEESR